VEKEEESAHGTIFTSGTQFGETRSQTFWEHFEASDDAFLGVKICCMNETPFNAILDTNIFPTMQEVRQSESVCKSSATEMLAFLFSHLWFGMMTVKPIIYGKVV